jgi:broad specificity phosphatase PhoE
MPDRPVCIYIVRHGQTVLNATQKFRGNANPPLDTTGIAQAHQLAKMFDKINIGHIFCSDKLRSGETAKIIAKNKISPVHPSSALNALDVGEFSGQKRTPESEGALQKYLDNPQAKIPGGESLADFQARIRPCIREAIHLYCESGLPTLIVGHSSVIHEVGTIAKGRHQSVLVSPGGAIAVYYDFHNQKLDAEPIYKPIKAPRSQAETIT